MKVVFFSWLVACVWVGLAWLGLVTPAFVEETLQTQDPKDELEFLRSN